MSLSYVHTHVLSLQYASWGRCAELLLVHQYDADDESLECSAVSYQKIFNMATHTNASTSTKRLCRHIRGFVHQRNAHFLLPFKIFISRENSDSISAPQWGFLAIPLGISWISSSLDSRTQLLHVKWLHSAGILLKRNPKRIMKRIPKSTRFLKFGYNTYKEYIFSW